MAKLSANGTEIARVDFVSHTGGKTRISFRSTGAVMKNLYLEASEYYPGKWIGWKHIGKLAGKDNILTVAQNYAKKVNGSVTQ